MVSTDLSKSAILKGHQALDLINLCEFNPNQQFKLLYKTSRDGFSAEDFHSKCDGKANTLTLFKASESSFIFGGFTSATWDGFSGYKFDPNAFLFSLTNKHKKPCKMKINRKENRCAIYCYSGYGPTFGGGHDIYVKDNANTTSGSYSRLGSTYKHSQFAAGTNEAKSFLAGSFIFQLSEIEVYQK